MQPYKDIHLKKYSYDELREISLSDTNGYGKIYWVSANFIGKLKAE